MSFSMSLPSPHQSYSGSPWLFSWLQHMSYRTHCLPALFCSHRYSQGWGHPTWELGSSSLHTRRTPSEHLLHSGIVVALCRFYLNEHRRKHSCLSQIMCFGRLHQPQQCRLQRTCRQLLGELAVTIQLVCNRVLTFLY